MKNWQIIWVTALLVIISIQLGIAQRTFNITIISDDAETHDSFFEEMIQTEIKTITENKYTVNFQLLYSQSNLDNIANNITQAYNDNQTDLIIGSGINTCNALASKSSYSKPTIVTLILDNELQGVGITEEGTSGKPNFTYIQSPFNIKRDFQTLYEIKPYQKIAILGENLTGENAFDFNPYFKKQLEGIDASHQYIAVENNIQNIINNIPSDVDAVYLLPIFDVLDENGVEKLLYALNEKQLPVFTLLEDPAIELGAFGGYESSHNLSKIPRRVALNAIKIIEGRKAETLSVKMQSFTENLLINMKTARKIEVYPSWQMLAETTLINVNEIDTDRKISLQSAIVEGLENNLEAKIAEKGVSIAKKNIAIAKSNYLPQVNAQTTGVLLDKNTVNNSFGTRGRFDWAAGVSASQLVLSEPAMANVAIQRLLFESEQQSKEQTELDIVKNVTEVYLGILQAKELVNLSNQNVIATKKNFDIAKTKEKIGYSGINDVYRWESELAFDNVDLNTSQAILNKAKFNLNLLLNRPISEEFQTTNVVVSDSLLWVADERLLQLVNNPGNLKRFADFLVSEAFANLPEIKQLQLAATAQERSLLSQKRAYYTPTIALSGQYDYTIKRVAIPEGLPEAGFNGSWNTAISLQIPIFQGNSRKHQKEQTQLNILQLGDQMANLRNALEFQVRANLETAGASFSNLQLSRKAADAAGKNFKIAQDYYQQGLLNITSLIDAQNAYFQAEINATNSVYQFIIDFMSVERSIGYFHFLAETEDKNSFFQRFATFHNN
jgi:outer membrane protein